MPPRISPERKPATIPLSIHRAISAQPTRKQDEREEDIRQAAQVGAEQEERAQIGNRVTDALNRVIAATRESQQAQAQREQEATRRNQQQQAQGVDTVRQLASQFEPEQASQAYLQAAGNRPEIPLTDIESEARKAEGVARLGRFNDQTRDLDPTQQGDLIQLHQELGREGLGAGEFQTAVAQAEGGELDLVPEDTRGKAARITDRLGRTEEVTGLFAPQVEVAPEVTPTPTPPPPQDAVLGPRLAIPQPAPVAEPTLPVAQPPAPPPSFDVPLPTEGLPEPTLGSLVEAFAPSEGADLPFGIGPSIPLPPRVIQERAQQTLQSFGSLTAEAKEKVIELRTALDERGHTVEAFMRDLELFRLGTVPIPPETLSKTGEVVALLKDFATGLGPFGGLRREADAIGFKAAVPDEEHRESLERTASIIRSLGGELDPEKTLLEQLKGIPADIFKTLEAPFIVEQALVTPHTRPIIEDIMLQAARVVPGLDDDLARTIAKYTAEFAVPSSLLPVAKIGKLRSFAGVLNLMKRGAAEGMINMMQDRAGRKQRGEEEPTIAESAFIFTAGALLGGLGPELAKPIFRTLGRSFGVVSSKVSRIVDNLFPGQAARGAEREAAPQVIARAVAETSEDAAIRQAERPSRIRSETKIVIEIADSNTKVGVGLGTGNEQLRIEWRTRKIGDDLYELEVSTGQRIRGSAEELGEWLADNTRTTERHLKLFDQGGIRVKSDQQLEIEGVLASDIARYGKNNQGGFGVVPSSPPTVVRGVQEATELITPTRSNKAWEAGGRLVQDKKTGEILGNATKFTNKTVTVGGKTRPWKTVRKVTQELIEPGEAPTVSRTRVPKGEDIVYTSKTDADRFVEELAAGTRTRPVHTVPSLTDTPPEGNFIVALKIRKGAKRPKPGSIKGAQLWEVDQLGDLTPVGKVATREVHEAAERAAAQPISDIRAAGSEGTGIAEDALAGLKPARTAAEEIAEIKTRVVARIKEAIPVREAGEAERTIELARRSARVQDALDEALSDTGEAFHEGLAKAQAELKGKLPIIQAFDPLGEIGDAEFLSLSREINVFYKGQLGKGLSRLNTQIAWEKLWLGANLRPFEVDLLTEALGEEVGRAVFQKQATFRAQLGAEALALFNSPRAIRSSYDFSMPLRQAFIQSISHPLTALYDSSLVFKALRDPELKASLLRGLVEGPEAARAGRAELRGLQGLEQFENIKTKTRIGTWLRKIPGIRISEDTAALFLALFRRSLFDRAMANSDALVARGGKALTLAEEKTIADYLNVTTGWGKLGPAEKYAGILGTVFFSARLQAATVQAPTFLFKGATRKMAARDLGTTVAFGMGLLTLAKMSGLADVELDPRSPDFAKMKIGPTRINLWGPFQPIARFVGQVTTGEAKTGLGEIRSIERFGLDLENATGHFLRSKLQPSTGFIADLATGETFLGEPLTRDPPDIGKRFLEDLTPLFLEDLWEATQEQGALGFSLALPGFLGVTVTSYTPTSIKFKEAIGQDYMRGYLRDSYGDVVPDRFSLLTPRDQAAFENRHPDLVDELAELRAQGVQKGDPIAIAGAESERIQEAKHESLLDSETRFGNNEITVREYRNEIENAELEARGAGNSISALFEAFGLERVGGAIAILQGYYDIFDQYPESSTNTIQRDALFEGLEAYRSDLSARDLEVLESNLNLSTADLPVFQEFRADKRIIGDSGFWDLPEQAWEMVRTRVASSLDARSVPEDYSEYLRQLTMRLRENGVDELAMPLFIRNDNLVKLRSDIKSAITLRWRSAHLDVMPLIQKWGYGDVPQAFIPAVRQEAPAAPDVLQRFREAGVPIPGR